MDPVLALDIGTRTVVGLLALPAEGGRMAVVDAEIVEHGDRAMRDGQVHDIPEVGRRVALVAQRLAARNGLSLARASVAAAGRALRTVEASASVAVPRPGEVTEALLRDLAIGGVAEAVERLASERAEAPGRGGAFHCVGFSIVRYLLDGEAIDNPLGQRGEKLEAALIATFLPRVVTDGLLGALRRADLDVAGLTLEPIAAANAAIPPTMRALNLALVDIGAGTSDIAVSREGAVTGYAMVPRAGDALTEAIAQAFLLDFPEAERVKVAWGTPGARASRPPHEAAPAGFEATNVLGQEIAILEPELQTVAKPVIEDLALKISREVIGLNGKAPAAVLCIGGGSLSPGLANALAAAIGLPASRVGVRGAEMVKAVDLAVAIEERAEISALLRGPAGVTPLGIAWGALYSPGFRFRDAWVRVAGLRSEDEATLGHLADERRVQVLDLGRASVFDALVSAGIPARDLAGRPGLGMAVRLDGELRLIAGTAGKPAEIKVNGESASLDAPLPEGARLVARIAMPGDEARARVADIVQLEPFPLSVNGTPVAVTPVLLMDGVPASADAPLHDGAELVRDRSLATLLPRAGVGPLVREILGYRLDGVDQELPLVTWELAINGVQAFPEDPIAAGDAVRAVAVRHPVPRIMDIVPTDAVENVRLLLNGTAVEVPVAGFRVLRNGIEVPGETLVSEGDDFRVKIGSLPIVADLLGFIQSELVDGSGPGRHLQLQVDGLPAQFTTSLCQGARIDARWVEIQTSSGLS